MSGLSHTCIGPAGGHKKAEYLVVFLQAFLQPRHECEEAARDFLKQAPRAKVALLWAPGGVWFKVADLDETNPDKALAAKRAIDFAPQVNAYIDTLLKQEGIHENRVILAGFSQGATQAFYTALMRTHPVAGVYALSGGALDQIKHPVSKPPVALAVGEKETHVYNGVDQNRKTAAMLEKMGFITDCAVIAGEGHRISPQAIDLLARAAHSLTSPAFRVHHAHRPKKPPVPPG